MVKVTLGRRLLGAVRFNGNAGLLRESHHPSSENVKSISKRCGLIVLACKDSHLKIVRRYAYYRHHCCRNDFLTAAFGVIDSTLETG